MSGKFSVKESMKPVSSTNQSVHFNILHSLTRDKFRKQVPFGPQPVTRTSTIYIYLQNAQKTLQFYGSNITLIN